MGWDEAALEVGSWSRDRFGAELDKATRIDKDKLLRLRLRWHIDEFGELIVRPLVECIARVTISLGAMPRTLTPSRLRTSSARRARPM